MRKRTRRAAALTGAAATAVTGVLLVTLTTPAGAAPRHHGHGSTQDRLAAQSAKLSEATKRSRVGMYDHEMGSQIKKMATKSSLDTVRQAQQSAFRARMAGHDVKAAVTKRLTHAIWKESGGGHVHSTVKQKVDAVNWNKLYTVADTDIALRKTIRSIETRLSYLAHHKPAHKSPKAPKPSASTGDGPLQGIDVSGHQGNVNWSSYRAQGKKFAYIKATEGTGYTNPYWSSQFSGSYKAGLVRGSYHFARPDLSSGSSQARFFAGNGGGWSGDGKTLPGALDMEFNPAGSTCYGKSQSAMTSWIKDFVRTYHAKTSRYPVIYTAKSWWDQCVGGGHGLQKVSPIWVARYNSYAGALPSGWGNYTFWQYSDQPIDKNEFAGSSDRLRHLALGR